MATRNLRGEWGMGDEDNDELVTCVARLGRSTEKEDASRYPHVTGARMARSNGHEASMRIRPTTTRELTDCLVNISWRSGATMYVQSCLCLYFGYLCIYHSAYSGDAVSFLSILTYICTEVTTGLSVFDIRLAIDSEDELHYPSKWEPNLSKIGL